MFTKLVKILDRYAYIKLLNSYSYKLTEAQRQDIVNRLKELY